MTFKVDNLISFLGWETLASSLIEKARYCSMIPRDKGNPLDLHNECLLQLQFLEWCKTDPQVPQIVKDYVNQITFEKNYDQYVFSLNLRDSFKTTKYEPNDFESWYKRSVLNLIKFNQAINYRNFYIHTQSDTLTQEIIMSCIQRHTHNMEQGTSEGSWLENSWDFTYVFGGGENGFRVPGHMKIHSAPPLVSNGFLSFVYVNLYMDKSQLDLLCTYAGSKICRL